MTRVMQEVSREKSQSTIQHRAFIVDDDVAMCDLIDKILLGLGFLTHVYSTAAEVEEALGFHSPDFISLDLSLGNSDAVEVLKSLSAARFTGKVLLISGRDEATLKEVESIGERLRLHMLPFLHKPFRVAQLREILAASDLSAGVKSNGADLESGLRNNWLELWYQPKLDIKTRTYCGAEALIRLRHPELGLVEPSKFLPPIDDPLYTQLTNFVVRRSFSDWSFFEKKGIVLPISINVPASVLEQSAFIDNVRRHLPKHESFPGLIVELTEGEAIANVELAHEIAVRLKLYNIRVSIDDFGVGFSTLSRLKQIPFSELKLDRKFVHGCSRDPKRRIVCEKVVKLARRFNLTTVAEGVENKEDLQVLSEMGYDIVQGFLFAKPMPRDELAETALSSNATSWQNAI